LSSANWCAARSMVRASDSVCALLMALGERGALARHDGAVGRGRHAAAQAQAASSVLFTQHAATERGGAAKLKCAPPRVATERRNATDEARVA
jgi:hypothetical protein